MKKHFVKRWLLLSFLFVFSTWGFALTSTGDDPQVYMRSRTISNAFCAPTLGSYSSTTVIAGQNASITPTAAPTNTTSIVAYTSTNFSGTLTVNPTTGAVSVTNAKQAGTYLVTVKAFSSAGCTSTTTFTLTVSNPNCSQGDFSSSTNVGVGTTPISVGIGDFNGDGKQDIAVANYGSANVSIRLGDGAGGFSGSTEVSVGTTPYSVAIGDFNGDGKQDIAVANSGSSTVSIRLGDGAGGFSGITNVSVGTTPSSVDIGDFNGDGKQDIATANYHSNTVSIRLGDGTGGFSGSTNVGVGSGPRSVAIGDFNGDGKQDIAAPNGLSNTVSIRLGDGAGGFSGTTEVSVGTNPFSVAIGDFNGDGKQDIAAANRGSASVSIRLGDGTGGFSGITDVSVGTRPLSLAIGDFNGDGKQDIAASNNYSYTVSIRLGNGTGGFSGSTNVGVGTSPESLAIGDFNGDGKQDIAIPNSGSTTVSIRLGVSNDPSFTVQPGATACAGTDVTYTTQSGQTTYVWTVPGTLNTDYTITSGGLGTSNNTVTLKWLTTGSKTVTINYTNANGCTAATATSSTATIVGAGPTLGSYSSTTVIAGQNASITPTAAPANSTSIVAYSSTNFTGTLTVNPATGVVSVTNAKQAGTYLVTVKAFSSGGCSSTTTFTLTVSNPLCSQGNFSGSTSVTVGTNPYSVAIGDFNGDGKQDIAIANDGSASVSIRLGDGAGGFSGTTEISVGANPRSVAIGDFNGDGKQDFAVTSYTSNTASIRLGDGAGGFSGTTVVSVGNNRLTIAIGDFNGDGKQDIAAGGPFSTTVSIRLGDGAGGFSGSTEVNVGSDPYGIAIGDFNGDGKQDIATANYRSHTVSIRLGDGAGGFSGTTNVSVGANPQSVAIGDFNGDGKQDIAAATNPTVSIRLGDGTGGFSGTTEVNVGSMGRSVAIGDFNGDGKQDIATTASIRLGDGAGGFSGTTTGGSPYSVAIGDFNGDGKQDIAVVDYNSGSVLIYLGINATFTAQPGATVCPNTDVTYTTQSGQTNYVWTVPGTLNTDYTITSGGLGSTSNTVTLKWLTAGSKTVTINYTSNGCTPATATSSTATMVSETPVFLIQPLSSAQSICSGVGSLQVEVDPGSGTVASYKWYRNASALNSGGSLLVTNTTTAVTNSYSPTTTAYYYVTATNSNGCVDTSTVSGLVTISALPSISGQPSVSTQSVCINGTPTNLSVTAAAGSGTIANYKWYSNTSNSNSGGTLVSTTVGTSTTNSYTPSTAVVGTKYYYCVVTNSNGCSVTSTVSGGITVVTASVGGTATAAASSVLSGSTTTVTVSGYTGTIQWQQSANGSTGWATVTGGSGGTTDTYTTPALTTNTYYRAALTNGSCAVAYSTGAYIATYVSAIGDVLVVSGGGSGGAYLGGGGGGGAVKYFTSQSIGSTFAVTVGSGGAAVIFDGVNRKPGLPGQSSSFGSLVATSSSSANGDANAGGGGGGSGGGGYGYAGSAGGTAVSGMGYNGGIGVYNAADARTSTMAAGGGGGAGAAGGNGSGASSYSAVGGNGGVGVANSITGASVYYGGGGGGSVFWNGTTAGSGGNGGGGAATKGDIAAPNTATSGTPNTGGGGGGHGSGGYSGAGGSGVVIVRYPGSVATATGGVITYPTGYVVHTFNSSGTFTWTGGSASTSITSTGVATSVCTSGSAQTSTLAYSASTGSATSYSIDWNAAANTAGFADQASTSHAFAEGGGSITGITIPAGVAAGTYTGTLTITGSTTYTQSISLSVGSVSGTITGAGTVASGTNSTTLTLSGYTGSIQWQSSPDNSTFSNIVGQTTATYTATNLTSSTFYKAVVTNGSCTAATSSVATITVASPSTAFGITGSTTANTMSNNVATVVDPNIVVTANGTVSGFTVSITADYTDGDVLGYTGSLPNGVTVSAFNPTSRSIVFTGTASAADWQTLLRTVTLTSTSNCYPTNRKVSFLPSNKYYNYFNGHYYDYISTPVNWATAKADAASRSFYGRKGYLVTITSEAENNYIWKLIGNNSWIGLSCSHTEINTALGYNKFSSTTYGQFYWVTGPEKGTLVSTGLTNPVAASGVYNRWLTNEPNNYRGNRENSGHMYNSGSAAGYWNDFPATNTIAYIVEYGGSQGDDTSATVSFTRDIIISGSPAGTISGAATVCNGTNSTTLTFSGTGTVQRWEYSTDNFVTAGTTVVSTASTLTATNLSSSRYYRAVVNTSGCTNLASSSALITVATSTAGSITALSGDVCVGGNAALTLNGNSGDIQKWQVSTSADFTTGVTDISNTTNDLSYPLSSNGTYYFRAAVLNSACVGGTPVYTEGYPVTVTTGTPPVGGTVNSVDYCGGSNSGTLTLSGATGTSYQWEVSTDGGVVYTDAGNTSTTLNYTGITTTTKYRVLVTSGSCGTTTSSVGTVAVNTAYVDNTISLSSSAGTNAQTTFVNEPISNIRYVTTGATGASFSGLPSGVTGAWANDVIMISGTPLNYGSSSYTITLTGGCAASTVTATGTIVVNTRVSTAAVLSGTATICNGTSTNLSVAITDGTGPYTVVYSNGTSNITVTNYTSGANIPVSPTATTTYSLVSVSNAYGFAGTGNSGSAVVTVNPVPVVAQITGNTSICSSATSQLTSTTTGGVWSSATPNVATVDNTGLVTRVAVGTSIISYTVTNASNCSTTVSTTVTVNALPTPTFTSQAGSIVCMSTDVTYTTESGQSSYVWTVPGTLGTDYSITSGGIGSTSNTVTLKWLTSGSKTVTINYNNASGCSAASATSSTATTVRPSFTTGVIATTGETICYGGTPASTIGNATASSGGDASITYSWRSSVDGYLAAISGATSDTYLPPAGLTTTTSYRRYATDGTCNTTPTVSTGTWTVTVSQIPTTANAGPDQNVSSSGGTISATLAGNTPAVGTGLWTIVSGTGGTITTPTSPTSTLSGTAGVTYVLRWTISNSPCNASSDEITITSTYIWTGSGGDDLWDNGNNWSAGSKPNAGAEIVISSGNPKLNTDYSVDGSLTLSGTATLTVNAGKTLSVPSGGVADFSGKLVTFKSDATGTGQLGAVAGTLTGATNVVVERHIPAGKRAFRFFSSSVTTTGSIRDNWMEGATPAVGNLYPYRTQSVYNPNLGYGTLITGTGGATNGFDASETNNPSLFTFNNSTNAWTEVASTAGTITAGNAYRMLVRGDRSYNIMANTPPTPTATILRTRGTIVTGTRTSGTHLPALNQSAGGWSLVGNPYQSVVDMSAASVVKTNLTDYYYVWDPRMGTRGAYVAYNYVTSTSANVSSAVNRFVQPGQAFFVQSSAAGSAIQFTEAAKGAASNQSATFGKNEGIGNKDGYTIAVTQQRNEVTQTGGFASLSMLLYETDSLTTGGTPADATRVLFAATYSNNVDLKDGRKFTNLDETMAVKQNNTLLSMELRALPDTGTVLPLSITQYRATKYTLRVFWDKMLTDSSRRAYLRDKFTAKEYMIDRGGNYIDLAYTITSDAKSSAADRFEVVFRNMSNVVTSVTNYSNGDYVRTYPNPVLNLMKVEYKLGMQRELTLKVYDMSGRVVLEQKKVKSGDQVNVSRLLRGIYQYQLIDKTGKLLMAEKLLKD